MEWDAEDVISWVNIKGSMRRRDADHNPTVCIRVRVPTCTQIRMHRKVLKARKKDFMKMRGL